MDALTIIQVLDSTVRLATPLLLACLAGLYSERAGVFDIGLEGKMLAAAFFSAAIAAVTGSVWLGLLAGTAASLVLAALHGLASITFRGNQLISGVAINFLAAGMTVLIAQDWFKQGGRTPSLLTEGRFSGVEFPFAIGPSDAEAAGRPLSELISEAGVLQQIYSELLSGHSLLVYAAFLAVPLTWWVLFRTRFGCAFGLWGKTRQLLIRRGFRSSRLDTRPLAFAVCYVELPVPIWPLRCKPAL